MGYYTRFQLSIIGGDAPVEAVLSTLHKIMFGDDADVGSVFDIDDERTAHSDDTMKWYDHDDECAEMSKQFPGVLFKLHGEGEEAGDLWDAYYRDGLCQICRGVIAYPPFDSQKLKSVSQAQKEDSGR